MEFLGDNPTVVVVTTLAAVYLDFVVLKTAWRLIRRVLDGAMGQIRKWRIYRR